MCFQEFGIRRVEVFVWARTMLRLSFWLPETFLEVLVVARVIPNNTHVSFLFARQNLAREIATRIFLRRRGKFVKVGGNLAEMGEMRCEADRDCFVLAGLGPPVPPPPLRCLWKAYSWTAQIWAQARSHRQPSLDGIKKYRHTSRAQIHPEELKT
jgi:hypothetical protein